MMKKVWIIGIGALVLAALFWLRPHKDSAATKEQEVTVKSEEIAQESARETKPRKRVRASEADWAEVNAIAAEYKPQLSELEQQWSELKANKYYKPNSGSRSPEIPKKYSAASKAVWNTEKAIRTLEREQWAQMEAYLSPYELRKYRMKHSLCSRLLRQETNWMEPPLSEGEFLSLFIRKEGELDFLDEHFDGDYGRRGAMFRRAQDKIRKLQEELSQQPPWSRRDAKVAFAGQAENDLDCRLYREYSRIGRGAVPLSTERAMQVAWGREMKNGLWRMFGGWQLMGRFGCLRRRSMRRFWRGLRPRRRQCRSRPRSRQKQLKTPTNSARPALSLSWLFSGWR